MYIYIYVCPPLLLCVISLLLVLKCLLDCFPAGPAPFVCIIKGLHVSMCACHPCAGAMLIFSASFQFSRMIPEGNPRVQRLLFVLLLALFMLFFIFSLVCVCLFPLFVFCPQVQRLLFAFCILLVLCVSVYVCIAITIIGIITTTLWNKKVGLRSGVLSTLQL